MSTTNSILIGGAVILVGFFGYMWLMGNNEPVPEAPTTEDVVLEQEEVPSNDKIFVTSPLDGASVSAAAPISVAGNARGYWYFEATAPVSVLDADGLVIGQGYIEAAGDWMTEDFVPFSGTITLDVTPTPGEVGQIVFARANPSGMPENDEVVVVDVVFN